jgi:hypothetical protein
MPSADVSWEEKIVTIDSDAVAQVEYYYYYY